jgi:hypothetical protein
MDCTNKIIILSLKKKLSIEDNKIFLYESTIQVFIAK